jgi:DNA-binding IclR family transcriptional regulator
MNAGTLVKGLQLIAVLAAKRSESSLTELAGALEIDKSTIHRILAVMATMGFVEKNPNTKHYRIGPQFLALASPDMAGYSKSPFQRCDRWPNPQA